MSDKSRENNVPREVENCPTSRANTNFGLFRRFLPIWSLLLFDNSVHAHFKKFSIQNRRFSTTKVMMSLSLSKAFSACRVAVQSTSRMALPSVRLGVWDPLSFALLSCWRNGPLHGATLAGDERLWRYWEDSSKSPSHKAP